MDTVTAVRNRILSLCGERGISINQLAALCALPPSSIKNILYPETERCRTPHGVRGLKYHLYGKMRTAQLHDRSNRKTSEPK